MHSGKIIFVAIFGAIMTLLDMAGHKWFSPPLWLDSESAKQREKADTGR